jgi:hypothetical protein
MDTQFSVALRANFDAIFKNCNGKHECQELTPSPALTFPETCKGYDKGLRIEYTCEAVTQQPTKTPTKQPTKSPLAAFKI